MQRIDFAQARGEFIEIGGRLHETGPQNGAALHQLLVVAPQVRPLMDEPDVAARGIPSIFEQVARPRRIAADLVRAVEEKLSRRPG